MSYILISKKTLIELCHERLRKAEADKLKAFDDATETASHVWWRELFRLEPLSVNKAKERLIKIYKTEMFGGPLGSIEQHYKWAVHFPNELLAACEMNAGDILLLSVKDAATVESWRPSETNS